MKIFGFLLPTNFKLLSQIKENSVSNCNCLKLVICGRTTNLVVPLLSVYDNTLTRPRVELPWPDFIHILISPFILRVRPYSLGGYQCLRGIHYFHLHRGTSTVVYNKEFSLLSRICVLDRPCVSF